MTTFALLVSLQDTPAGPEPQPINALGTLFMVLSVGFVVILTGWCFYRVLTFKEGPHAG
jgi:hypothetical protein